MYAQYWGLVDIPFHSTVDMRWFFEGPTHEEALARLLFLLEQRRRFGLLVGRTGTGKSLLLSVAAKTVRPAQCEVAVVDLACLSADEMLWELAAALQLSPRDSDGPRRLWRKLEDELEGRRISHMQTLLAFDHLDRASPSCAVVIERLVHLSMRATPWTTILVAVEDRGLSDLSPNLLELVDLRVDLPELDADESRRYVEGLLHRAGGRRAIFENRALDRLHELSGGNPGRLNDFCDLSLLAAMSSGSTSVSEAVVTAVSAGHTPADVTEPATALSW